MVVCNYRQADNRQRFAVIGIDLGNGKIEPAFKPADKALNDLSFILQRPDTVQMDLNCQRTYKHYPLGWNCLWMDRSLSWSTWV